MTRQVSLRQISGPLLLAAVFLRLTVPVAAQSVSAADYRVVGGMRVPYRYVESSEQPGRTIYQVERVEVGDELNPDTFTLQP